VVVAEQEIMAADRSLVIQADPVVAVVLASVLVALAVRQLPDKVLLVVMVALMDPIPQAVVVVVGLVRLGRLEPIQMAVSAELDHQVQ
jgi:hypothetical protein